ncbi:MAG: hypothetical protein RL530_339 [Actinomycetota bacterium]
MLLPLTPLDRVLGDRTAKALARHLGLRTISDLLQHYPRRYYTRGELTPISQIPVGEAATVVAAIVDAKERRMKGKSGSILEVRITDGDGIITLTFFNQAWRLKDLRPGARGLFAGKISAYQGKLQLAHPEYELFTEELDDDKAKAWAEHPIPIYPAASAVTTWAIQRALGVILDTLPPIEDEIPALVVASEGLMPLEQALRLVHQPNSHDDYRLARETLRAHEAFVLQAALLKRRAENAHLQSTARVGVRGGYLDTFDKSLPFTLTNGQVQVGQEITEDLAKPHPMNRLLQGEVGSGKTLVALRAMLTVADSGGQSAVLAPTEVLASQHFASFEKALGPELAAKLGLTLLTGQMSQAERKRAMLQIVSGKAQLVVGTHALIANRVEFFDLGLTVIDEQHRFGVEQREALRLKGKTAPHVLTMTATPIPRTLAVTVFGDLDVSTLTELPGGRQGISSHVVQFANPGLVARTWQRIAEECASGRQAFVVCPRIDEDDPAPELIEAGGSLELDDESIDQMLAAKPKAPIASALGMTEALRRNPALAGLRIEVLHGRMSGEEKNSVMGEFATGKIDVLVSTTVIEVGVNVPNATVMVVLDADRFGVAQLHQLRGRVGRGEHPGLCLLLTTAEDHTPALERVQAVAATTDGFELSQIDLELRREGDVLGDRQSGGKSSLRLLRVVKDVDLIQRMRRAVEDIYRADPTLEGHPQLAETLSRMDEAASENLAKS